MPGSYNWTQVAMNDEGGSACRMSRAVLFEVSIASSALAALDDGEPLRREHLTEQAAETVAQIEQHERLSVKLHDASVGPGAGGFGAAVEIIENAAVLGGASAAVGQTGRLVIWAYHKIASATGRRPCVSLGAAEHLATADLIDRVRTEPHLMASGDMCSNSADPSFTGGDAFFVVLATESELHHYHVSAYGETHYIGTSPLIPHHYDSPPPYWAGGDLNDD